VTQHKVKNNLFFLYEVSYVYEKLNPHVNLLD
jgi:hypothetical protein